MRVQTRAEIGLGVIRLRTVPGLVLSGDKGACLWPLFPDWGSYDEVCARECACAAHVARLHIFLWLCMVRCAGLHK